jgi:hypothetical protein
MLAARVLSFIVYQASARDPLPARRALAVDPLILLRDE